MGYGSGSYGSESFGGSAGQISHSITFTLDANLGKFFTFTLDARLLKPNSKTFTLDARLLKTNSKTFTLDAILIFRRTLTFTLDARLLKTNSKTFTLEASVQKGQTKTFTIDSILIHRIETTFKLDALISKTFRKTFTIGARCYIAPDWLNPWKYRKLSTICGGTNTLAPGYIQITVHKGVGISTGENVYLSGRCKDDFSDIRFTKQDGTSLLLHTLVSSVSGNNAIFLVKVDYIPASPLNTSIYIYYHNSSATSSAVSFITLGLTEFETSHVTCRYNTPTLQSGFETFAFDDSGWLDGNTPFHTNDFGVPGCPSSIMYNDTNYTNFPYNSVHVYIRKKIYSDSAVNLNINFGIDNNLTLYFNETSQGSFIKAVGCAHVNNYAVSVSLVKGLNIIAFDISGDAANNAFDFKLSSITGIYNTPFNDATFCGWGNQEQTSSGRNLTRTHRIGLRIING